MVKAKELDRAKRKAILLLLLSWMMALVPVVGVPVYFGVWKALYVVLVTAIGVAFVIRWIVNFEDAELG